MTADHQVRAALLTTRGGAFRDLENIGRARECAHEAIKLSPSSFHPYNLLGALHYEEGDFLKGDNYFEKALGLGATPRMQESEIRIAP